MHNSNDKKYIYIAAYFKITFCNISVKFLQSFCSFSANICRVFMHNSNANKFTNIAADFKIIFCWISAANSCTIPFKRKSHITADFKISFYRIIANFLQNIHAEFYFNLNNENNLPFMDLISLCHIIIVVMDKSLNPRPVLSQKLFGRFS